MIQEESSPFPRADDSALAGTPPRARRRRGWLAFVLSFLTPGLGQLYAGYPWRATFFYALPFLLIAVLFAILSLHRIEPWNLVGCCLLALAINLLAPVDAILVARRQRVPYELRRFNRWYVYAACVGLFSIVSPMIAMPIVALGRVSVQGFKLSAGSMEPTLLIGDRLLVDNLAYGVRLLGGGAERWHLDDPRRGDLVTLRFPNDRSKLFIKRVVGLPGEKVEIGDKLVKINGQPLREPYAQYFAAATSPGQADFSRDDRRPPWGPKTMPTGQYFVLGDNRDNSLDSRYFGSVPREDILGRVRLVYWSVDASRAEFSRESHIFEPIRVRWRRIGLRVE
jgi:signal peptidase I